MKRFKNILLFANSDFDNKSALQCAFHLAMTNEAQLKIVDVVKESHYGQPILPAAMKDINLHNILIQEKHEHLNGLIRPFNERDVDVSLKVLTGTPFISIIREVIQNNHDLVIVTPEGRSEFKDMLFGSTTMHLMRKCPCPVWAIKPSEKARFTRILAAVDPNPSHRESTELNAKILEMASSLAEIHESQLHVIHAWDFNIRSVMIPQKVIDEMETELRNMHNSWYDELLKKHVPDLPASQIHRLKGDAAVQLSRFAMDQKIDLFVMGTVCRTGIPELLIGNTAERVLYRVDCSVLAVKPDGYISPVKTA